MLSVSAVALFWHCLDNSGSGLCHQAVFASSMLRGPKCLLCRCCKLQSWSLLLKAWESFWQPGQLAKLTLGHCNSAMLMFAPYLAPGSHFRRTHYTNLCLPPTVQKNSPQSPQLILKPSRSSISKMFSISLVFALTQAFYTRPTELLTLQCVKKYDSLGVAEVSVELCHQQGKKQPAQCFIQQLAASLS